MEQAVIDHDMMIDYLSEYFRRHPPPLDEILGAVCEIYQTDPVEIEYPTALMARRMYCYIAARWGRCSYTEIGSPIDIYAGSVGKAFKAARVRLAVNPALRNDLDLVAVRVAERILIRKRLEPS